MHVVHIALQGCLKAGGIDYGLTADTGGHIRYLLDLVDALERHPGVRRQTILTRGFDDPSLGLAYARPRERYSQGAEIVRLFGQHRGYLSKEDLHRDSAALVRAFLSLLARETDRPSVIHAHYADAGTLAHAAKMRFGIPFVFTAHSLGRMKRLLVAGHSVSGGDGKTARDGNILARREAIEDQAIDGADLIIASSRDEAEGQLGGYPSARPERVRVNPPGVDVGAFAASTAYNGATARIRGELTRPDKPIILAIARPVWRKNLHGLLAAYAASDALQDVANLVIVAGHSHDAAALSHENRAVLAALFAARDARALAGKVALPTQHSSADVPGIYAMARASGGIFANVAFHEPFGLTLIEAAAAGLPVLATAMGGPRDILARCRNGRLVDPHARPAIAGALEALIGDRARWRRYAQSGQRNVDAYTWRAHAGLYVRDLRHVMKRSAPLYETKSPTSLFLSDIDNTLIGCRDGLRRLLDWRQDHPSVLFGVATGRSIHHAVDILQREKVPPPEVMITSVGSEIYYPTSGDYTLRRDEDYTREIVDDWDPEAIVEHLSRDRRLTLQPPMEQRALKRCYTAALTPEEVSGVREGLAEAGLPASVIYSHHKFLDILPRRASKGAALRFVARKFAIASFATAAAGDSGNDRELLEAAALGIVVANHNGELADLVARGAVRVSRGAFANGIVEQLSGWPATIARPLARLAPPVASVGLQRRPNA